MSLVVVLVNWQDEEQTLQCARTLRSWQTLKPELLVVDNQSTKASCNRLRRELTTDEVICSHINRGYAGGNNLGIGRALEKKKDYILLLNTDAEISEAGVTLLLERLKTYPDISILGPVVFEHRKNHVHCLIGGRDIARHQNTRIVAEPNGLKSVTGYPLHEVDYVLGTVFLTRRSLFEEIGLLDEQFFFSGEIPDFCKRARNEGHKACTDLEASAYHNTNKTPLDLRESLYVYYNMRNRFLYIKKHCSSEKLMYFSYWMVMCGLKLAYAMMRWKTPRARAILLALEDALLNKFGDQNDKFI
jgi:GT2 family glycosyltransferase